MASSVKVSIGRKYRGLKADATLTGEIITDEILDLTKRMQRRDFIRVSAPALAKSVDKAISTELMKVGKYITTYMIGLPSKGYEGITQVDMGGEFYVEWRKLAKGTVFKKRQKYGAPANLFFKASGALSAEIGQKVGPGLVRLNQHSKLTGKKDAATVNGVSVTLKKADDSTKKRPRGDLAELRVQLFPGMNVTSLYRAVTGSNAKDLSMTLERRLGLSARSIEKLLGPSDRSSFSRFHRPLVQPALQYFLQIRIPRAIRTAIRRSTGRRRIESGVGDLR